MRTGSSILLLQTLAGVRQRGNSQAGIAVDEVRTTIDAWASGATCTRHWDDDLSAARDAVKKYRLAFWDVMLWAAAQRAGACPFRTKDGLAPPISMTVSCNWFSPIAVISS